ncbi:hypothetical protein D3C75_810800 [compost metagenome]
MIFDQPRDKYADVMTLKEFSDCVKCGGFIPYDGDGYFGTETHFSFDSYVWNEKGRIAETPEGATHVHWYNR